MRVWVEAGDHARDGFSDAFFLVELHAGEFEAEAVGERPTTDGDEDFVGGEGKFFGAALGGEDAFGVAGDFRAGLDLEALLGEDAGEVADDVVVVGRDDFREKFDDGDVGAQARPDGAEFETDGATADDHEFLRDAGEVDGVVAGDDAGAVKFHERQLDGRGAGRDDDVFGGEHFVADFDRGRRGEARGAREDGDLTALGELGDAPDELRDDVVFFLQQRGEVEFDAAEFDAVGGGVRAGEDKLLGGMKQRFAGDAADVEASAAEGAAFVDEGDFEAELRGAKRADVAARAGADDDQVEGSRSGRHRSFLNDERRGTQKK